MAARVLIIGGGIASLEATLALRRLIGTQVEILIAAGKPYFEDRPLRVMDPFTGSKPWRLPLDRFAADTDADAVQARVRSIDTARRTVATWEDRTLTYDRLLVATGARPQSAVEGAITYRGFDEGHPIEGILAELQAAEIERLAFVVPAGIAWSLPAYELALLTATWLDQHGVLGRRLTIVTPERRPLEIFGDAAAMETERLLERTGIALVAETTARSFRYGALATDAARELRADQAIALPRLTGPALQGLPSDPDGFIPIDEHARVPGAPDVWAAGDVTAGPVKQGGLAAQQADAAAESIAASLGLPVEPRPIHPVLRGILVTGRDPAYLRSALGSAKAGAATHDQPFWWLPTKVVARELGPYLARHGRAVPGDDIERSGLHVEVDLRRIGHDAPGDARPDA